MGSSDAAVPNGQEPAGDYGSLEAIARNRVNLKRITTHWPDMLCVAGALITNQARAYDLLRMFGREGHPTSLGAAFAEYGRIDKTMHLLALVDPMDDTYRRLMNRQLTVQESRHRLARAVLPRRPGPDPAGIPRRAGRSVGQAGARPQCVVLWNTRYLDAAVAQLRAEGHDLTDEDAARLSPLKDRHINSMGATSSIPRPVGRARGCGPCVIRTRPSWTRTTTEGGTDRQEPTRA
ncbi:Tn3 family transposase [Streptomyces sp. NPDC057291]|uniref:Tn3 family transposase n=1 Tax=Streptomyces sp. NPDC057291 TaxID=3346087 RepID=UPI0036322F57